MTWERLVTQAARLGLDQGSRDRPPGERRGDRPELDQPLPLEVVAQQVAGLEPGRLCGVGHHDIGPSDRLLVKLPLPREVGPDGVDMGAWPQPRPVEDPLRRAGGGDEHVRTAGRVPELGDLDVDRVGDCQQPVDVGLSQEHRHERDPAR